jgi:general secretion pathway protein A
MPAHIRVAYVLNSKLNVTDLLASICDELGIELPTDSPESRGLSFSKTRIDALNQNLFQAHAEGKKTLIVIEEAQNLSADVLETLRLLSNLETNTHKLLHILLVGQPELLDTLAQKELRQLNQRVVSRFHLLPLEKDDVANYVNHRLRRAGAKSSLFNNACISVLFRLTGGVPRLINLVCQHSLLATYSTGSKVVSPKLVKEAAVEILGSRNTADDSKKSFIILIGLLVLIAVLMIGLVNQTKVTPEPSVDMEPSTDKQLPEALELPVNTEPSINETAIDVPASPFSSLLKIWSVDSGAIYSEEEFSAQATDNRLRAEKITAAKISDLERINRPGIVWIKPSFDSSQRGLKSYLLTALDKTAVRLEDTDGSIVVPIERFLAGWSGRYLYLWQPPHSFNTLTVGDRNAPAVSWLQDQLVIIDQNSERIITGGRYTAAIAQKVASFQSQQALTADGVVGRETVMRLNQLASSQHPRLVGEQP